MPQLIDTQEEGREVEGSVWQLNTTVMTVNLNGWYAEVGTQGGREGPGLGEGKGKGGQTRGGWEGGRGRGIRKGGPPLGKGTEGKGHHQLTQVGQVHGGQTHGMEGEVMAQWWTRDVGSHGSSQIGVSGGTAPVSLCEQERDQLAVLRSTSTGLQERPPKRPRLDRHDGMHGGNGRGKGLGTSANSYHSQSAPTLITPVVTHVTHGEQPRPQAGLARATLKHRCHALMGVAKRHNIGLIGIQEHHWNSADEVTWWQGWLRYKGWAMEATFGVSRWDGVALLWKTTLWEPLQCWQLEVRLLVVQLRHMCGDVVNVLVGHFENDGKARVAQWKKLGMWLSDNDMQLHITLADHNSVVHEGQTTRWRPNLAEPERDAIEEEEAVLGSQGLVDQWEVVHGDALDNLGFTHQYRRGDLTIDRRIDRIHVHESLVPLISMAVVIPVGGSDHHGVVCSLTPAVELGRARWKFKPEMLQDVMEVEGTQAELSRVKHKSFAGWQEGIDILRRRSQLYSARRSQRSPLWIVVRDALRSSSPSYVPMSGWIALRAAGVDVASMSEAYGSLQRLMIQEETRVQKHLALEGVREALRNEETIRGAKSARLKAVHRMMRELQGRRAMVALRAPSGRMVSGQVAMGELLRDFWTQVTPAGLPGIEACRAWLEKLRLPAQWKTTLPLLWKPRTIEVLQEALRRIDGMASPGDDGIYGVCYHTFAEFFLERMEEVMLELENGGSLPAEWTLALVRPIPKTAGAIGVQDQRPIALQQVKTKWLMTVILVQVEDALALLVPQEQKAYVRGRRMEDHLVSVASTWGAELEEGWADAWIAIDYSKAYDSLNHSLVEAVLEFVGMPPFVIAICLEVMRGETMFLVGKSPVRETPLMPQSGIRQGDPFSPLIFVLVASLVVFVVPRRHARLWLYSDDTFIRVACSKVALATEVEKVIAKVREFGLWSGLRLNMVKSEAIVRGVTGWTECCGIRMVEYVRYLGAYVGRIDPALSFAPAMNKVWNRCLWMARSPLDVSEKVHLMHTWVYPCLRIPCLLRGMPQETLRRLNSAVRMAFNLRPWRMSMEILTLPVALGGVALMKPEVFVDWVTASTFWRWVNGQLTVATMSTDASTRFRAWCATHAVVVDKVYAPLIHLAASGRKGSPWLVESLSAWSRLMSRLPGAEVKHEHLLRLPLCNNKLLLVRGGARAPTRLIQQGKTVAGDLIEASMDSFTMPADLVGQRGFTDLSAPVYETLLRKVLVALKEGRSVVREGPSFDEAVMATPLLLSQRVSQGSKQDVRQPPEVWRALARVRVPGRDRDFMRQVLWGKLPVAKRVHAIFPAIPPWCPLDFGVEDHYHRTKTCSFLGRVFDIMSAALPVLYARGQRVELSRLVTDFPLLSLRTGHGVLLWKAIRCLWIYRCGVTSGRHQRHLDAFLQLWADSLAWWTCEPELHVPTAWLLRLLQELAGRRAAQQPSAARPRAAQRGAAQLAAVRPSGSRPSALTSVPLSYIHIYTDGSYSLEPCGRGFAGSGVWVPSDPTRNLSVPLPGPVQSNNRAELFAVILALRIFQPNFPLAIFSDSQYVVKGVNDFLPRWKLTSFRNVSNSDLWITLENEWSKRQSHCIITWVPSHQGIEGNEGADKLANEGREKHPERKILLSGPRPLPPLSI